MTNRKLKKKEHSWSCAYNIHESEICEHERHTFTWFVIPYETDERLQRRQLTRHRKTQTVTYVAVASPATSVCARSSDDGITARPCMRSTATATVAIRRVPWRPSEMDAAHFWSDNKVNKNTRRMKLISVWKQSNDCSRSTPSNEDSKSNRHVYGVWCGVCTCDAAMHRPNKS